jgi:hypothetical protein
VEKIDNSARERFEPSAISRLKKKIVVTRFDGLSELTSTVRLRSCNAVYVQHLSAGPQPFVKAIQDGGAKVSFHCMGWCSHRQGDSFATISEWVSKRFHQSHYVPYMVNPCLSDSVANKTVFRSSIGVSETDTLVCYLGSKHSFDHNIVRQHHLCCSCFQYHYHSYRNGADSQYSEKLSQSASPYPFSFSRMSRG